MDRTPEFKAAVNSFLNRGHVAHPQLHRPARKGKDALAFAEFSALASAIGKDLTETGIKLQQLTKLVKRKALFDDRPVEITELTFVIKQDLSRLNGQIALLQQHVRATNARSTRSTRQVDEHSANVVIILQSKLANTSMSFKEALEIRTESMQASKKRQDQLLHAGQTQAPQPLRQTGLLSPLRNKSRSPIGLVPITPTNSIPDGRLSPFQQQPSHPSQHSQQYSNGSDDPNVPYSSGNVHRRKGIYQGQYEEDSEAAGPASMLFQQQQHAPQDSQYIQNRSTAIEAVESTLQELGGIFQQLAQMVAEQRDTVQRIEANTDDIELNINEAQNQLLRYYRNISSDRGLMIKMFLTVIFCFLVISLLS